MPFAMRPVQAEVHAVSGEDRPHSLHPVAVDLAGDIVQNDLGQSGKRSRMSESASATLSAWNITRSPRVTTWGQTMLKTPAVSQECFGNDLEHRSSASSSAACDPFGGPSPAACWRLAPRRGLARGGKMAGRTRFRKTNYSNVF